MRRSPAFPFLVFGLVLAVTSALFAVDIRDTRLLTQPAISRTHIAFHYANDLWVADLDGRNVRRLTSDLGLEANPVFSPDGSLLAFTAQYDGNYDVYTVPVAGGVPQTADLASGQRLRPGHHAGRQVRSFCLEPGQLYRGPPGPLYRAS